MKGNTMDPVSIGVGFGLAFAVAYFLCLAATKGLPAAYAWLKAKWSAAGAELATDVGAGSGGRGVCERRTQALADGKVVWS
jgi:hypothetical protein